MGPRANDDVVFVGMVEDDATFQVDECGAPGMCVSDTACSRTMHGPGWKKGFAQVSGVPRPCEVPSDGVYRGIGGSTRCLTKDMLGTGIFGYNGQISSMCLDQDIPALLSKVHMNTLDVHIHLRSRCGTATWRFSSWATSQAGIQESSCASR